ncbi:MAG: hypothetical protein ACOX8W_13090 [bacterium]
MEHIIIALIRSATLTLSLKVLVLIRQQAMAGLNKEDDAGPAARSEMSGS